MNLVLQLASPHIFAEIALRSVLFCVFDLFLQSNNDMRQVFDLVFLLDQLLSNF